MRIDLSYICIAGKSLSDRLRVVLGLCANTAKGCLSRLV